MTEAARSAFVQAMATRMGHEPTRFASPGVSISADPARATSHTTSGYIFGSHLAITCDPAALDMLQAAATIEPSLDAWNEFARANNGEFLGAGRMQLLRSHDMPTFEIPAGYTFRDLDREDVVDRRLISQLIDASSEDDLDEVELNIDELNTPIKVIIDDATGTIAAFADAYAFDMAESFIDVGILTTPAHRGKALGKAATKAICEMLIADGREPLYRCDEENLGSIKLSASLGFEPVTHLAAYRFGFAV